MKKILIGAAVIFSFLALVPFYKIYSLTMKMNQTETIQEYEYRVVFISSQLGNPYWQPLMEGMEEAAEEREISLDFSGAYQTNEKEMAEALNMAIASKVDGIILMGMNTTGIEQLVNKATTKGIPVFTVMNDMPNTLRKTYIGTEHIRSGREVGAVLFRSLKNTGTVAVIKGDHFSAVQELRLRGLKQSMANFPAIKLVELPLSETEGQFAREQAKHILNEYPDVQAFVGLGQEDGPGIVEAIQKRSAVEDYGIYTFDATNETRHLFESGFIDGTISHDLHDAGQESVERMVQWLKREALPLDTMKYTDYQITNAGTEVTSR
jgi:ribose transport system substrate-binding protein